MARLRADQLLVQRGLFESRAKAQEAIAAGLVCVDGAPVSRPSQGIDEKASLSATAPYPWVSRGGVKLDAALAAFGYDPAGLTALDVGASTGGFTDVLLARGAAHVFAVDVGRDQLHAKLRGDPRVTSLEAQDIRTLSHDVPPVDLAVVDVSFIGLRLVLPSIIGRLKPAGWLVALIKPQFEAGRAHVVKGLVRDEAVRQRTLVDIEASLRAEGFAIDGPIPSPIEGGDGNVEYLIGARRV